MELLAHGQCMQNKVVEDLRPYLLYLLGFLLYFSVIHSYCDL